MNAAEHGLDQLTYVFPLVIIDRHCLDGQTSICPVSILTNEAVPLQPACQGGLCLSLVSTCTCDGRVRALNQPHSWDEIAYFNPILSTLVPPTGEDEVIGGRLDGI